jgi:hypothetical protein
VFDFCDTHQFWVFKQFRIKESPVPGISRTLENQQRPDGFRQIFDFFLIKKNHGYIYIYSNWAFDFFDNYGYLSTPSI